MSKVIYALIKKSFDGVDEETLRRAAKRGSLVEQYATELMRTGGIQVTWEGAGEDDEMRSGVMDRLEIFERWWSQRKPILHESQKLVFSEVDGIAGTLDWIIGFPETDDVFLVDCKCTAQPERTWILQVGAYLSMLESDYTVVVPAVLHINPKYKDGYIWREYDMAKACAYWQRALAWYRILQELKAEAAE